MSGKKSGAEILIVDNSDTDWKVLNYLREWTEISRQFDIATGYFEIGSLLALENDWQKLDKIRVLMGDEVTKRTRQTLLEGLTRQLDDSLENEKEKNDFLKGVPAILEAIKQGKIECRVYTKKKFHAKAYITHSRLTVVGSSALVGSSNFTKPGLINNIELNVQLRREVDQLQAWFDRYWNEAEDVSDEVLKTIERHTRDYLPFEIYARALKEYFRRYEIEVSEWEKSRSRLYNKLDIYQQDGYKALMKISEKYRGAFLCDGVGLGKTFVGMMLIERLVERDRKRVALFVPKATLEAVWKPALKKYLPGLFGRFSNLEIFSHTDLSVDRLQEDLKSVKERADVIIIDEAHNFRNPGLKGTDARAASRYYRMADIIGDKKVFLLTATPINNSLIDLQRLIELFTNKENNYFRNLGVHSLPAHFRYLEKQLEDSIRGSSPDQPIFDFNQVEAGQILGNDELFRELVVQRSRSYVRESQKLQGGNPAQFPKREVPQVAEYSIKKTYGKLLDAINKAFSKKEPLFTLAIYSPTSFLKTGVEEEDIFLVERQKQLVGLIRTLFLKRFESSAEAFRSSCEMLYRKMLAFATRNAETAMEKSKLDRIKRRKEEQFGFFRQTQRALFDDQQDLGDSDELTEDIISPELLESFEVLDREKYNVHSILNATFDDMEQILDFLDEFRTFEPKKDDKLQALIRLLKSDRVLKKHKVLIFSEYLQTARYLFENLKKAGIEGVSEIDGGTKPKERLAIVRRFSPFYNDSSNAKLANNGEEEIRVLISTDVLAEGLNLQDATRLINYDLHWNPVRLMQRIGRVDRRLDSQIEEEIVRANPDQKEIRGTVVYWNFLPPDELDSLLNLYAKVSNKVLKISRVFGIEGKKLLKPEDDYEALKDFNHELEGDESPLEKLHLEYQELLKQFPELDNQLTRLPNRIFSGKKLTEDSTRAVFFCYELPEMPKEDGEKGRKGEREMSEEGSAVADGLNAENENPQSAIPNPQSVSRWYLYNLETEQIEEDTIKINEIIRCSPETPRFCVQSQETLIEIRQKVEKYLKRVREKKDWQSNLILCSYRPFDNRYCYFSTVAMDYPRRELIDHVAKKENLCFNIVRQTKMETWQHAVVSKTPSTALYVEVKDGSNVFPLYLYPTEREKAFGATERVPNFSAEFIEEFSNKLGLNWSAGILPAMSAEARKDYAACGDVAGRDARAPIFTPEDVFAYAYAVFHSPTYRARYAEFLKIDFPRLPLTTDTELFRQLCALGAELVQAHLLESIDAPPAWSLQTDGAALFQNHEVAAGFPKYEDGKVFINKTNYFNGIPEPVWNFHIGGYQVCHKWLKDRKARTLLPEDIAHYGKIVVALRETIRLMAEIDKTIEERGGFPLVGSQL